MRNRIEINNAMRRRKEEKIEIEIWQKEDDKKKNKFWQRRKDENKTVMIIFYEKIFEKKNATNNKNKLIYEKNVPIIDVHNSRRRNIDSGLTRNRAVSQSIIWKWKMKNEKRKINF